MIEIKNITKSFPPVVALNDISFRIEEGTFFGLLGPNGAGKTTTMNLLIGYLQPDKGELLIDGEQLHRENLEARKHIGYVPQSISLYDELSAQANLEIFGSFFGIEKRELKERIKQKLTLVGLYERKKDLVRTYSGGMKRRLNIAASLLHDPKYLLCDEPTVGVDPQSRNAIFDLLHSLNDAGKTIIYTTHYMEEAERLCDTIAIIDKGTIIASGTIDDLLRLLPFDESVVIAKSKPMLAHLELFDRFGEMVDCENHFELKPSSDFRLSSLFTVVEELDMGYQSIELRKPTLETVFLHLTGRTLRD